MKSRYSLTLTLAAALSAAPLCVHAQTYTGIQDALPIQISLDGNVKHDAWYNLSRVSQTRTINEQEYTINGYSTTGYPTTSDYPGYRSGGAWLNPIRSQFYSATGYDASTSDQQGANPSSRAGLTKIKNSTGYGGLNYFNESGVLTSAWNDPGTVFAPYVAGSSIYAASQSFIRNAYNGTVGVFEDSPVLNLQNIVLQIEIASAFGYDFYYSASPTGASPGVADGPAASLPIGMLTGFGEWAPTLHLTFADTTTTSLISNYAAVLDKGFNGISNDEEVWINLYGFQWDLSAYNNIESFIISWDMTDHAQLYGLQLDQSSVFNGEILSNYISIPEPGTYAALFGGALAIGFLIRRHRTSALNA